MTATKVCSECGKTLPLDAFSPKKRGALGRNSMCKCCVNMQYHVKREALYKEQMSIRPRDYDVKREPQENGRTLVKFGDRAHMQPRGEHRTPRPIGGVCSPMANM